MRFCFLSVIFRHLAICIIPLTGTHPPPPRWRRRNTGTASPHPQLIIYRGVGEGSDPCLLKHREVSQNRGVGWRRGSITPFAQDFPRLVIGSGAYLLPFINSDIIDGEKENLLIKKLHLNKRDKLCLLVKQHYLRGEQRKRCVLFCAQILSLLWAGWNNSRPAWPVICCTLWGSKPERERSCEAVMHFHRGVLSVGKSNRLEYQWDVPESVTAHLLSDRSFSVVPLWTLMEV